MRRKIKSKLILYIIIVSLALTGIVRNEFSVKCVDDSQNAKNDVISDLRGASGDWDPQITKSVGDYPVIVFIGDANNDGFNDIATANLDSDDVSILLWNSTSGDWDPQITKSVGNGPYSIFIGDANNDGFNDIATANLDSDGVSILLWNSTSGDWNPQITKSVGGGPSSIFIGDANNDGYNDIATAIVWSDGVSILLWNSTSGDWDPQITKSVGNGPYSMFIGDANNDGYNDIATANFWSDDVSILLWNSTSGDWDPQITKSVGDGPYCVFIGDANNNGYKDVATANAYSDDVSILLWNSTSGDWDPQITKSVGVGPWGVFIGDANNDGFNDIATANLLSDDVSILLWNSTSGDWNPQITKSVGNRPRSVFIGNANNDGYKDVATANTLSDDVSILLWNPQLIVTIISPSSGVFFRNEAPNFEISIDELNINTTWYNLNNGINITFEGFTGKINQTVWEEQGEDLIIIRFYANDTWGFEGYSEVSVYKDLTPPTSLISFIPYKESNIVNESTTFTITADDGTGSGVSLRQYKINNSGWIPYAGPFDLSIYIPGYYLITYQAIDYVGNVEVENTLLVELEKIPSKKSEIIPGYNLFLLISIICVVLIIFIEKRWKLLNK